MPVEPTDTPEASPTIEPTDTPLLTATLLRGFNLMSNNADELAKWRNNNKTSRAARKP